MSEQVERFMGPISSSLRPEADGQWVRYEDHHRLLREVEGERDDAKLSAADLGIELEFAELARVRGERKLEQVAQELEEEVELKLAHQDARRRQRSNGSIAAAANYNRLGGEANGLRAALKLLRDQLQANSKSLQNLEQGGRQGGVLEAVEEVGAALESQKEHVDEPGVAVEGGPGLQAFEVEWAYTFVARSLEDADAQMEKLDDFAESLGFNGEGGVIRTLSEDDLIPGSPTANKLREIQATEGERGRA